MLAPGLATLVWLPRLRLTTVSDAEKLAQNLLTSYQSLDEIRHDSDAICTAANQTVSRSRGVFDDIAGAISVVLRWVKEYECRGWASL